MPKRIQLSRRKGWRMPENTVSVARPGKWGNPFALGELKTFVNDDDPTDIIVVVPFTRREAVDAFRWLASQSKHRAAIQALRGKNLACWCPLDAPCHADVLLELANLSPPPPPPSPEASPGTTPAAGEGAVDGDGRS